MHSVSSRPVRLASGDARPGCRRRRRWRGRQFVLGPTAFQTSWHHTATGQTAPSRFPLTDAASGLASNTLSAGDPRDGQGAGEGCQRSGRPECGGELHDGWGLAVFEPVSGTALTDSKGVASINPRRRVLPQRCRNPTVAATVVGKTFTQTTGYAVVRDGCAKSGESQPDDGHRLCEHGFRCRFC